MDFMPGEEGMFAPRGGLPWQIDDHLRELRGALIRQDARLYADLVAQIVIICRPKLEPKEFEELSNFSIESPEHDPSLSRRQRSRIHERLLFAKAQKNLAECLRLVSLRGVYAVHDKSPTEPVDGSSLALHE